MENRKMEDGRTGEIVYPTESYAIIGACFEVYNDKGPGFLEQVYPDFLCYDKIIVEIKAVSALNDALRSQVHNYLKATRLRLGLLVNFGNPERLEYERIVR